jgi:hypothetical protein
LARTAKPPAAADDVDNDLDGAKANGSRIGHGAHRSGGWLMRIRCFEKRLTALLNTDPKSSCQ